MKQSDKFQAYNSHSKNYTDEHEQHSDDKSAEEAYAANMKLIKKQKARFKRLEKILSRNVFLIPFCVLFSVLSAVLLFVSTLSDHYEEITYNTLNIKKNIDQENNLTLSLIGAKIKKELHIDDLILIRKALEEKSYNQSNQYVLPTVDLKSQNLLNAILEQTQTLNIFELQSFHDYYKLTQRNYLDLSNSTTKIIVLYNTYSGIWKFCNLLSIQSRNDLSLSSCTIYKISNFEIEPKREKQNIDLSDPGRDLVRMHNAAACCTIVCYFLLISSWVTATFAGFSKKVPLTFATCVLNMLIVVFLALLLAIFHRKIWSYGLKISCSESSQIVQIVCQNRTVKFGYSLGLTWLAFIFTMISSICWLYITKMQKLLLAHGYFY